MNKKWEEFKRRAGEVLGHPVVQKAGDFGNAMLEITANLSENHNPLSFTSAVMASANVLADVLDIQLKSPIAHYCTKHDLQPRNGSLHKMLLQAGAETEFNRYRALKFDTLSFECLELSDTQKMYWIVSGGGGIERYDQVASDSSIPEQYWVTPNFDESVIADYFWRKYPNGINFGTTTKLSNYGDSSDTQISGLPPCGLYTESAANSVTDMVAYIRRSKDAGISRSFLLYGCPGGGKTSFVEKIGESFGKRIVKVESSFLDQVANGEIDKLVSLLQPEVVLFDDFDRIDLNSNEGKFLYITEDLKRKYPRVTFFATVNNPGELSPALLRPGRFDEKIKFLPPGPRECCKIIQMYATSMQMQIDAKSLEAAVGNRKFTPAECREAISRKVLRPELDMRFIMDDIERYRNFEDQEEEGKSDFDEDDAEMAGELDTDESPFTESEAAMLRDSIREIKNPRERAEVEKALAPNLSAAKRPRKPKKGK